MHSIGYQYTKERARISDYRIQFMIIESLTNLYFGRACGNRPNGDRKPWSDEDNSVVGRPCRENGPLSN